MPAEVQENENKDRTLAETISASKKLSTLSLIPYSDGRYVFYPNRRWGKGYVLSRDQVAELFKVINAKGMTLSGVLYLFIPVWLAFQFIVEDWMFETSWFWLAIAGLIGLSFLIDPNIKTKKLLGMFPGIQPCQHPFPYEYSRLKLFTTIPMFSRWRSFFIGIFMLIFAIPALLLPVIGVDFDMPGWLMFLIGMVMLVTSGCYFRMSYFQKRFKQIHGRRPATQDLRTVDPVSGRMIPSPFEFSRPDAD